MFSVNGSDIKWLKRRDENPNADEAVIIAMARVYCGSVKHGNKVYVLHSKYDPTRDAEGLVEIELGEVFMLRGKDLIEIESVNAGNICGIAGLGNVVLKTATLSSVRQALSLDSLRSMVFPLVRVAVEPEDPQDMEKLVNGLRMLGMSDPIAQVRVQETGEHVIETAGELHLETCLKDLRERFAKAKVHVSPPIVPFRETISLSLKDPAKDVAEASTSDGRFSVKVKCTKLPDEITEFLYQKRDHFAELDVEIFSTLPQSQDKVLADLFQLFKKHSLEHYLER